MKSFCTAVTNTVVIEYSGKESDLRKVLGLNDGNLIQDVSEVRDDPKLLVIHYDSTSNEAAVLRLLNCL
jgi:hypothetical protein